MKIGILGSGAFGIALAKLLNKNNTIIMWTKFEQEKRLLDITRINEKLLPGVVLDKDIIVTTDINEVIASTKLIINALPFVAIAELTEVLKGIITKNHIICSTTKGIDNTTLLTTTQIIKEKLDCKLSALSGPSFAIDIINNSNILLMLGAEDNEVVNIIENIFKETNIETYVTNDVVGIQLAGALKNAISIGAGMLEGLNVSNSTKAKYLTIGLIEMGKIIELLGGKKETAYTVAGVGDLILTCTSDESRNHTFGKYIGEGLNIKEAFTKMDGKIVEGYETIKAVYIYLKKNKIESTLITTLYDIIFNNKSIKTIKEIKI